MNLPFDAQQMNRRLRQRPTLEEIFSLAMACSAVGIFIWLSSTTPFVKEDYNNYIKTAHGDFSFYYYGYWLLPIFTVLARLPSNIGYALWCGANILGVFFAARVFGGRMFMAMLSYQMFYSLIYGQISGIIVGGLALCWWGIVNQKWNVAGLGIALASAKFQMGLAGSLFLLLAAEEIQWKDKIRALFVPLIIWTASLIIFPGWPLQTLSTIRSNPPNDFGSISLWRWMGSWALIFWVPPILLRLTPQRRFMALIAVTGLALPYFQQTDLLLLLVMPIGWIGLLGNLGFLLGAYGWEALQALAILPLAIYIRSLSTAFVQNLYHRFR